MGASSAGFVYVVTSPTFDGWCKVGRSTDPELRLVSMNGCTPYRDLSLRAKLHSVDARRAERTSHRKLEAEGAKRSGEWFFVSLAEAVQAVEGAVEKVNREAEAKKQQHIGLERCPVCGSSKGSYCTRAGVSLKKPHYERLVGMSELAPWRNKAQADALKRAKAKRANASEGQINAVPPKTSDAREELRKLL